MTKRSKDDLETLGKWRTAIRNLPEAAAPTPPAQEDEPVYQFRYDDGRLAQEWRELDRETFELIANKPHVERRILHTRPADDELRKAAEALAPWMSAALEDEKACALFKDTVHAFLSALERK
jgi:hypothetical protein